MRRRFLQTAGAPAGSTAPSLAAATLSFKNLGYEGEH
jgi:hypothetical protein